MKFLKNNLKTILAVGATAIICISGTAFAALQYQANSVSYTTAKNANIKNVEDALNDLYSIQNKNKTILDFHANNSQSAGWTGNKLIPKLYTINNSLYFSTKASNYGVGTVYYEIDNINTYSGFKINIKGNGKSFLAGISTNINEGYGIIDYTKMDLDYTDALKDFSVDRTITTNNLIQSDKYYIVFMSNQCEALATVEPLFK